MPENVLYYGDNLDVLRRYVKDESIDLIYLDPPFNSKQDYNVLFGERNGTRAAAQIKAFEDTWTWDEGAARAYQETVEAGGKPSDAMQAFRRLLGENDMLAYLSMMAPRLIELRRVLKPTGSLYLHCDPTASHYLKILMDAVFGAGNFRNEIIWKRTSAHGSAKRYGPVHDVIFFYARSPAFRWNGVRLPHDPSYVSEFFRSSEPKSGRKFHANVLTGARIRHGDSGKPWRGYNPTDHGRHWALPSKMLEQLGVTEGTIQQRLDALDAGGRVFWPAKEGGQPRLKYYADELEESTVAAAQALKRRWIGIDITHLAIGLIKKRLSDVYGPEIAETYRVIGEPVSVPDAERLAAEDPYQFQWWALGLVGARPAEQKKGADKGIDGRLFFHDDKTGETKQIVFSVKAGELHATYIRDLRGVVEREKAAIGVLISFQEPTKPMRSEAASAGFYSSNWGDHPRLQLRTIAELLDGKRIDYPQTKADATFKKAPRQTERRSEQIVLLPPPKPRIR